MGDPGTRHVFMLQFACEKMSLRADKTEKKIVARLKDREVFS
jgi:hypothetical protein